MSGDDYDEGWYDDGSWDDGMDYDWEGEDDEADDDDEEVDGEDDEEEEELALDLTGSKGELVGLNGVGRQQNCGIHTIEIYVPQFYAKMIEVEEWDATPARWGPSVIGKYTKGIGMVEVRLPADDEDPVSMSMSCVHRLVERCMREGFNETGRYTKDGKPIYMWNAVGRLDIGSESLIDRSKSMKTYCMDMFERYGDGETNIEGVDMYNACYGGQAAGLVCQSWVESDRWDGRYGIAVATDTSDVESMILFCGGSSCSATLYFPEAPLTHHSLRASCIMHRFDFHKPIGWHSMAPVTDGKYSVNAYMDAVDICHQNLKRKLNGASIVESCDYNIFHTGGGYHIVKKAYERMMRSDNSSRSNAEKQKMLENKLMPGVKLLKLVGPTHTVSSFLNMSSVAMGEWEKALGKTLVVFTYGSGAAASMYQTRFDDLLWMKPWNEYIIDYYREALYMKPWLLAPLHETYCHVWMKFDYIPYGREESEVDLNTLEPDAYYLMEIDPWGRRFYHRGGMAAPPRDPKWTLQADIDESRRERKDWGPLPPKPALTSQKAQQLEDKWMAIEEEMLLEIDPPEKRLLQVGSDRVNSQCKIVATEIVKTPSLQLVQKDDASHTYQIVGTWSDWKEPQSMAETGTNTYSCEITLGENAWEEFYILQDNDTEKKIFPAVPRSWKSLPCVGPHLGRDGYYWLLDGRDDPQVPLEDVGRPGDVYNVSFSWKGKVKLVEWSKVEGKVGAFPQGKYYLSRTKDGSDFQEMTGGDGKFSLEVTLTSDSMDFFLVRNKDIRQLIYPEVELDVGSQDAEETGMKQYGNAVADGVSGSKVLGPDLYPKDMKAPRWSLTGRSGETYKIFFTRNPSIPEDMSLTWEKQ
mmetsp:Transcript_3701/g.6598  ORF Transcript_3701/g.6598 Transcript_3701/m.6598 type:complete len:863 (+) Transcript_3701:78-2666(+)